jgi:MraZ protein
MSNSGRKWWVMVFIGQYNNNMDVKKRLTFPAKFRSIIDSNVYVTRGLDGCIAVYTYDKWQEINAKLAKLPTTKKQARDYVRFVLSGATEVEFDSNGRINLPIYLCTHANLTKHCVVVGVGSHIEIWDQDRWQDYNDKTAENFDDIAADLVDFEL